MSDKEQERRLAIIERRLELLFQDAKRQRRIDVVHHWKLAGDWVDNHEETENRRKETKEARVADDLEKRKAALAALDGDLLATREEKEKPTGWVDADGNPVKHGRMG